MDYLKLFQTHEEYEAFVSGGTMLRPNVSHCVNENEVHYNPIPIMTVKYNVTDASNPTQLYTYASEGGITTNGALMFDKAVIDGTEVSIADLDAASGQTQFSVGEHTVKYTLKDPTFIGIDGDLSDPSSVKVGAIFASCYSVESVEIPNSVTSIGISAFDGCLGLTSVTIPNSVTSIGEAAFNTCSGLTSITIPNSVTDIGMYAFGTCSSLTNIVIPNSVTTIDINAFEVCHSLTSVTIGNSVTSIGDGVFSNCTNLTSVTIPNGVTSIGDRAFGNCNNLTSITIPDSVTSIGGYAFAYCTSLRNIAIPDSVTSIGDSAFFDCIHLANVTIGNSVTSIGDSAFYECSSLTIVTIEATTPPTLGSTVFNANASGRKIYVPANSVNAYKTANAWSAYAADIEPIQ